MERSEVSRRLKAARWLRGGIDEKGRPASLSPEALAAMAPLQRNGITANAISEIERMVKDARPMELREIRDALDLPAGWFDAPITEHGRHLDHIEEDLVELGELVRAIAMALAAADSKMVGAAAREQLDELLTRLDDSDVRGLAEGLQFDGAEDSDPAAPEAQPGRPGQPRRSRSPRAA